MTLTTVAAHDAATVPSAGRADRRRRRVHERRQASLVGGIVAASTLVNLLWVVRDHFSPWWDQSNYLYVTALYQHALDYHGPWGLLRSIYSADPSHGPFFTVALLPFAYVFGPGPGSALVLNLVLWPVLLLTTGALAADLFGERARVPAIIALLPMPLVVSLLHTELQDFPLLVLTVVALWLLLRTRHFASLKVSLGLGCVMALGWLCKFSFPEGMFGPFVVVLVASALEWRDRHRVDGDWRVARRALWHLAAVLGIALVPLAAWYAPNWSANWAYVSSQYKPMAGWVSDPLSPRHLASFLIGQGNEMSSLVVGTAVVVGVASVPWVVRRLRQRPGPTRASWVALSFVAVWFIVPVAVLAANVNQDPRYDLVSYPALAVAIGAMVARCLRPAAVRVALVVLVVACLLGTLEVNAPSTLAFLPSQVSVSTSEGSLIVPLHETDGPARAPTPSDATMGLLLSLEHQARHRYGRIRPMLVLLLQDEAVANGNNLTYDAYLRHDPFTFITLDYPVTPASLLGSLSYAGAVLYVRQAPTAISATQGRVGEINVSAAARLMTPAMFAMFEPHPQKVDIAPTAAGASPDVAILIPRHQPR